MTSVLVTGATGFLGRHVVEKLRLRRCEVTTLARRDADVIADLADPAAAERALTPWRWDACINLAAPVTGGTEDLATGIAATAAHVRIALHLRRFVRGRLVHTSSMTVYGLPHAVPVTEDHPRQPMHLYGMGKMLAEDVLLADPDLDAIVLRFGGLFGEERRAGALFHFCRAAREGQPLRVTTPTPTPWELLHVADAAEGIVRAALTPGVPRGPINLGYGEPIELASIARRIADIAGRGSTVEAAVAHPVFQLATARAVAHLGWQPPTLTSRLSALCEAFA